VEPFHGLDNYTASQMDRRNLTWISFKRSLYGSSVIYLVSAFIPLLVELKGILDSSGSCNRQKRFRLPSVFFLSIPIDWPKKKFALPNSTTNRPQTSSNRKDVRVARKLSKTESLVNTNRLTTLPLADLHSITISLCCLHISIFLWSL